jgi:pilus assembly protein CpaB
VRRISPGTVTVGVLAIVLGLVAAYVARRSMEQKPPARDTVPVVVARVNLNANTRIRAEDLQVANVPRARSPEKALRTAAVAAGRVTKETIQAGQPVLEAQLWGIGESPALSERIPAGYRALTVNVVSPGSGLVRRDSLVDVALTVEGDLPTVGGLATKTLLSQVKVMEVGTRSTSRSRSDRANISLTLAVTPEQANKLIAAERSGTLSVSLCGTEENGEAAGNGHLVTRPELLGLAPPGAALPPYRVQKWNGSSMQIIEIDADRVRESIDATAADEKRGDGQSVPTLFGPNGAAAPGNPAPSPAKPTAAT